MEIFKLFGTILIDNDKANNSIAKTKDEADSLHDKLGKGLATAAKWGGAILGAAAIAGGAIVGLATKAAGFADDIDENSQKLGISKTAYQELGYVMRQNGMDIDSFKGGMKKLTNTIAAASDGNKAAQESFEQLGVKIKDANGQTRSQEDVMWDTMNAISGMTNQTDKAAMANKMFGKQGSELMPILNGGAKSIEEMRKQAQDLGIVLDDNSINAGAKFADTMQTLKDTTNSIFMEIGLKFMPVLQGLADWVIAHMPEIRAGFENAMNGAKAVFDILKPPIMAIVDAIKALLTSAQTEGTEFYFVWEGIKTIFKGVMDVITGVFKGFAALFKGDWKGLWEAVKTIFTGFYDIFKGIGKALFGKLWDGIKEKWEEIKTWVDAKIEWVKTEFLKIAGIQSNIKDNGGGTPHASGLNYVPYDGYVASLHRGEKIVTANANQNDIGLTREVLDLLSAILEKTGTNMILYGDKIVGEMAPDMNIALGILDGRG